MTAYSAPAVVAFPISHPVARMVHQFQCTHDTFLDRLLGYSTEQGKCYYGFPFKLYVFIGLVATKQANAGCWS